MRYNMGTPYNYRNHPQGYIYHHTKTDIPDDNRPHSNQVHTWSRSLHRRTQGHSDTLRKPMLV